MQRETSVVLNGSSVWQDLWIERHPVEQTEKAAVGAVMLALALDDEEGPVGTPAD